MGTPLISLLRVGKTSPSRTRDSSRPGCAGFFPTQLASLELSGGPIYLITSGQMNCPCAHAATRRRPGCAGSRGACPIRLTPFESRGGLTPLGSLRSSLAGAPSILSLRVGRASPSHTAAPAAVPPSVGPGAAHGRLLHTGVSHRVLRHPREASLTPQAPI